MQMKYLEYPAGIYLLKMIKRNTRAKYVQS